MGHRKMRCFRCFREAVSRLRKFSLRSRGLQDLRYGARNCEDFTTEPRRTRRARRNDTTPPGRKGSRGARRSRRNCLPFESRFGRVSEMTAPPTSALSPGKRSGKAEIIDSLLTEEYRYRHEWPSCSFVIPCGLCAQVVFRRSVVLKASTKPPPPRRQERQENPARQAGLRELRALRGSVVKSPQFRSSWRLCPW